MSDVVTLLLLNWPTVCKSNIKSFVLLLSTCHFLREMIQKAVLKKLLRGYN